MPRSRKIRTSTTETIPGLDYAVGRRMLTWGAGKNVEVAVGEMKDWAAEHNYDAIVGIRLESVVDVSSSVTGIVESSIFWVAYGTAVAFMPPYPQPAATAADPGDGQE